MAADPKATLRRAVLGRRDALPEDERARSSGRIMGRILGLSAYGGSGVVLAYASFGSEVRTDGFLGRVLGDGKALVLPRVEDGGLGLYEVRDPARDLAPGMWGIREPVPGRCPVVGAADVGFALVPGVAFDRRGRRLGYGGGFYDRLIRGGLTAGARIVAGAFEVQLVDEVPVDLHDAPVDAVVTERGVYPPA